MGSLPETRSPASVPRKPAPSSRMADRPMPRKPMLLQIMKCPWRWSGKWRDETNSEPEVGRERLGVKVRVSGISTP